MNKTVNNLAIIVAIATLGLLGPSVAIAATTPSLGAATSYGILGTTYTNPVLGTTVNGDIGFTTAPAIIPSGVHTNYGSGVPYASAGADQGAALIDLNSQLCTSLGAGAIALDSIIVGANPPGTFPPGCYSSGGAMDITLSTTITLNGVGTYIFKPNGALTTGANANVVVQGGASACDVFWIPTATTLGANSTMSGTIIDDSGITVGDNVGWVGRALAFASTVTTGAGDVITAPTCTSSASLRVVKHVVNDNGGTQSASAWMLSVVSPDGGSGTGSALGVESPGTAYTLQTGKSYNVTEDAGPSGYTASSSSDCIIASAVADTSYVCTITNDDVSARLRVVKVVQNMNGGSAVPSSFSLFVQNTGVNVSGSPAFGVSFPGIEYILPAGPYVVGEIMDAAYTKEISGDCDALGNVPLSLGDTKTCTITNTDISRSGGGGGGGFGNQSLPAMVATVPTVVATMTPNIVDLAPPIFIVATSTIVQTEIAIEQSTIFSEPTPSFPNSGLPPEQTASLSVLQVITGAFVALVLMIVSWEMYTKVWKVKEL